MANYTVDGNAYVSPHFRLVEFVNTQAEQKVKFKAGPLFPVLLEALEYLRERLEPLKSTPEIDITSGYRTPEYNASIGGNPNSEHLDCYAVDVKLGERGIPAQYQSAAELIWRDAADLFGFIGDFGYYDTHTHLGVDAGRFGATEFLVYDERGKTK